MIPWCSSSHLAMLVAAAVTSLQAESHKKPSVHHYFTAHLTWSAVSTVIAHVRPARHSPLAQSMEGHSMAPYWDTSTRWLRSSERECGGWGGEAWCHLMNTARPAGGTKCIRCNFNSRRSFPPKSDWMVHILQFKTGGWEGVEVGGCLSEKEVQHSSIIARIKEILWFTTIRRDSAETLTLTARISETMKMSEEK